MRRSIVGMCVVLVGCSSESLGPDGSEVELPMACEGDSCGELRACVAGVCVGTEDDLVAGADVDDAVRAVVRRGCVRAHAECSDICDNLFVECFSDVDTCADSWAADYLEDFDNPLVDPVLAGHCAAQVDVASCTDLQPDTLECDFAVVESCAGDDDAYGAPYSPFHAARIAPGDVLALRLCEDVEEYFAIELQAGEQLSVTVADDANVSLDLYRMSANSRGEAVLEEITYLNPHGDLTPAMPDAGVYLLEVRSGFATGRFELTIATGGI